MTHDLIPEIRSSFFLTLLFTLFHKTDDKPWDFVVTFFKTDQPWWSEAAKQIAEITAEIEAAEAAEMAPAHSLGVSVWRRFSDGGRGS